MNSPLENREVRLRGLRGGLLVRGAAYQGGWVDVRSRKIRGIDTEEVRVRLVPGPQALQRGAMTKGALRDVLYVQSAVSQ